MKRRTEIINRAKEILAAKPESTIEDLKLAVPEPIRLELRIAILDSALDLALEAALNQADMGKVN